jgi:hypothetical protein
VEKAIGDRDCWQVDRARSVHASGIISYGRNTRHEDRRECASQASLPFHGNPLPFNGMRFYPALWQEFENFQSLGDHSRTAPWRERMSMSIRTPRVLFTIDCGPEVELVNRLARL